MRADWILAQIVSLAPGPILNISLRLLPAVSELHFLSESHFPDYAQAPEEAISHRGRLWVWQTLHCGLTIAPIQDTEARVSS